MLDIKGKNVLILGAARSGVSAARLALAREAGRVVLSDAKPANKLPEDALSLQKQGVELETDGHKDSTVAGADIIVLSPGVPTAGKSWFETAERNGKPIYGEIEFAYQFLDRRTKIIAITGTNGKTTATMLCYEMLRDQLGDTVAEAGNIGTPLCDLILQGKNYEYLALETSSFQLETIKDFRPYVSCVLNITEDHLDRYSSMQEYAEAKARVFLNQGKGDYALLNADDKFTPILSGMVKCEKILFSVYGDVADGYVHKKNAFFRVRGGKETLLFPTEGMALTGKHNYANAMAGIAAADIAGLDMKIVCETMKRFRPAPHRIEFVAEVNGKKYIDDSKGTNIDAVMKAVDAFTEDTALILGGREKGTDFAPLLDFLPGRVKHVIVFGENREKLYGIFSAKFDTVKADDMEDVVKKAEAFPDVSVVLLSPGCASFDMYRNYEHRGEEFKKQVNRMAKK